MEAVGGGETMPPAVELGPVEAKLEEGRGYCG